MLLEVIVQSVADAIAAARGGADRLEVVRDIRDGGLTPSLALVRAITVDVPLPLRVMVRANAGYETTADERQRLRGSVTELAELGVNGIVLGFAREGRLALADVVDVLDAAPDLPVTFHRAFDTLLDPLAAIDELTAIPAIDRLLTSGGDGTPAVRAQRLQAYADRAGTRLTIVAGGGVDEAALMAFAASQCVREVHVGRAARVDGQPDAPVSAERVRRLRSLLDTPTSSPTAD